MSAAEFAMLAIKCCVLIGCPEPSAEQVIMIHTFVCDNFRKETSESFFKAFEMNAGGSLSRRVEHYQSFDAHFVGAVLAEFETKYREMVKEGSKVRGEEVLALPPKPSDDTMNTIHLDHLKEMKEKGSSASAEALGAMMFDWLDSGGKLTNLNDDLLSKCKQQATATVKDRMKVGSTTLNRWKSDKALNHLYVNYKSQVVTESKRLLYIHFLKTHK